MAFFVNIGYNFKQPASIAPDGSVILASAMPMHQLERRKSYNEYPHMQRRLFDPQLYLAGLDAAASVEHCTKLASYAWFGVAGIPKFSSGKYSQPEWAAAAKAKTPAVWPRTAPTDAALIPNLVKDCVDLQVRIGCEAVILPSPLTADPGTTYGDELMWLDAGLEYCHDLNGFDRPIYATVALADVCVRYSDPPRNPLLELILDTVSARGIQGVYIVLEQGSEPSDTRQCGNTRGLWSILHLAHVFGTEARLRVGVNFMGAFGLACEAAGASWWASNWYKSLYRLRLADKLGGGRSYPLYWTYPGAIDVHLETEFGRLAAAPKGLLLKMEDQTTASAALLRAASLGTPVGRVPGWRYAQGNVGQSIEHYLLSVTGAEQRLSVLTGKDRPNHVQDWLERALAFVPAVASTLGTSRRTKTDHVLAWRDAFLAYRQDHKV